MPIEMCVNDPYLWDSGLISPTMRMIWHWPQRADVTQGFRLIYESLWLGGCL